MFLHSNDFSPSVNMNRSFWVKWNGNISNLRFIYLNTLGLGINRMYTNQVNFITISVKFNILHCNLYIIKLVSEHFVQNILWSLVTEDLKTLERKVTKLLFLKMFHMWEASSVLRPNVGQSQVFKPFGWNHCETLPIVWLIKINWCNMWVGVKNWIVSGRRCCKAPPLFKDGSSQWT